MNIIVLEKANKQSKWKKNPKKKAVYTIFSSSEELVYAGLDKCLVQANLIP